MFGYEFDATLKDAFVTITHFWDADRGPDDRVEIVGGLLDYPNAWQKAKSLWAMALGAYADGDKDRAYELLGHVAHLIGDMTVPTHAHDDTHVDVHDDDPYEEWMSGDGDGALFVQPLTPEELAILQDEGPLRIPDGVDGLEWLMHTTSQIADFFPSMDEEGDATDPKGWAQPELDFLDQIVISPRSIDDLEDNDDGNDNDDGDLGRIRQHSYLRGIQAIAALYGLFEDTVSFRVSLVVIWDRLEEDEDHDDLDAPDYWTEVKIAGRQAQNRGDRVRNNNDLVDPNFVFAHPVGVTGNATVDLAVWDFDGWVGNPFDLDAINDDDLSDIDPDSEDDDSTLALTVDLSKCLRREAGAISGDVSGRCGDQLITGGDDGSEATKVYFRILMSKSPPTAEAGGPYTTNEGSNVTLDGGGSSDPNNDIVSYQWDLDNDGQCDDATGKTPTFDNVGRDDTFTVRLCVTDAFGFTDDDTVTVTVVNVAPAVGAISTDSPRDENSAVSISGAITDAGFQDPLDATIDFGDGSGAQVLTGVEEHARPDGSITYDVTHTYGDDGVFTVKVCGADDDVSNICSSTPVTVNNMPPTATIGQGGADDVNGTPVIFARRGESVDLEGRSIDPGSDDLTLTWNWDDGDPAIDRSTTYLVNPPAADPDPSPSVQPRDVTDTTSHAFGEICAHDITFAAADDDTGATSDTIKVMITGNADEGRPTGDWARQYRQRGGVSFDDATLTCYLEIAGFVSTVFSEIRNAATLPAALDVLTGGQGPTTKRDQLDRDLLTAWLNFANGAVEWNEVVDSGEFHEVLQAAEAVRRDPNATSRQLDDQRAIVQRVNSKI